MIRWYDWSVAFITADIMSAFIFNGSFFGGLVAYMVYELWDRYYVPWRLKKETDY